MYLATCAAPSVAQWQHLLLLWQLLAEQTCVMCWGCLVSLCSCTIASAALATGHRTGSSSWWVSTCNISLPVRTHQVAVIPILPLTAQHRAFMAVLAAMPRPGCDGLINLWQRWSLTSGSAHEHCRDCCLISCESAMVSLTQATAAGALSKARLAAYHDHQS
ncbi:hypothetical protein COO60DRAFT_601048 [Scenedesmus sp. NREL 46B-D3]|nr:hypothetical protein COO60DRAFT_601048 [Scenedesmus sp. NREL 46B-D3]